MKRHLSPMTARFWVWLNDGWVKLALRHGQSLNWREGHMTDEGWSAQCETYSRIGEVIYCEWHRDGRDCDGYLSQYGVSKCEVSELAANEPYGDGLPDGVGVPNWVKIGGGQYDEYAAMAGY